MDILRVDKLSKNFGDNSILEELSFSIQKGEIVGFVGKNGAGKTTTMKCIIGLIPTNNGSIYICEKKIKYGEPIPQGSVGYLQDVPNFYGYMNAKQYLSFFAELSKIESTKIEFCVSNLLRKVGLENYTKKKIADFSRGMKQRLGLAQAIINSPKLLICDEPTSALDPNGRREMLELLHTISDETAILFSTHILSDVERICNRIIILDEGKIKFDSSSDELKKDYATQIFELEFRNQNDIKIFENSMEYNVLIGEIINTVNNTIKFNTKDALLFQKTIWKIAEDNNITIKRLEEMDTKIEDIFTEVTNS